MKEIKKGRTGCENNHYKQIKDTQKTMNKKLIIGASSVVMMALPAFAMAAFDLQGIILTIQNLVYIIFVAAAVIYFLIYGIMFLMARGDPTQAAAARMGVMWGVVGIVVGVLALTIVELVKNTFGV